MGVHERREFDAKRAKTEISLIGLAIADMKTLDRVQDLVDYDDFSDPLCQTTFRQAVTLYNRGRFTLRTLEEQLVREGVGAETAADFLSAAVGSIVRFDMEALAGEVRQLANKERIREALEFAEKYIGDAQYDDVEYSMLVENAFEMARKTSRNEKRAEHFAEGVDDWIRKMRDGEALAPGISTGLASLDETIGGYRGGELIVVGGRPSMGKTVIGTSAAIAAARSGLGVYFASLEMPRDQLRARVLCDLARDEHRIEYNAMMAGRLSQTDIGALTRSADVLKALPIIVDERGALTAAQISLGARRAARQFESMDTRLGMVVVDYLQLMALDSQWKGDKNNGVGANSAALKQLAKDYDCAVVLLSQLNRSVESRDDKRPMMSDLRDSGSIEQDADVVMFPFRREYYLAREVDQAKSDAKRIDLKADLDACRKRISLIIEKQRNGPRGTLEADCDIGTSSIRDRGVIRPEVSRDLLEEFA